MINRYFHTCVTSFAKEIPKNLKGKSKSSQQWIERQLSDPYVEKAKMLNYRCRSAFKLLEIDKKCQILHPGQVILDCGGSPGSWTQVAVSKSNSNGANVNKPIGFVVAIDLLPIYPIDGAHTISNIDFTTQLAKDKINSILNGRKIDCVISDMAPNATGIRSLDQENITSLCYNVLRFAVQMSAKNATLLVKVWDNGEITELEKNMGRFYKSVKCIKPNASRNDSAEKFILAKEFIGLKDVEQTN